MKMELSPANHKEEIVDYIYDIDDNIESYAYKIKNHLENIMIGRKEIIKKAQRQFLIELRKVILGFSIRKSILSFSNKTDVHSNDITNNDDTNIKVIYNSTDKISLEVTIRVLNNDCIIEGISNKSILDSDGFREKIISTFNSLNMKISFNEKSSLSITVTIEKSLPL